MTTLNPRDIDESARFRIVDVRSADEFMREHIPGSRNLPLDKIHELPGLWQNPEREPAILTCLSGSRAEEARLRLQNEGFPHVVLLEGGLQGWKAANRPTRSLKSGISIMRQVQIIAGSLILTGTFVKTLWFLPPLVGFGLLVAGLSNTCLMARLLGKMPWNQVPDSEEGICAIRK